MKRLLLLAIALIVCSYVVYAAPVEFSLDVNVPSGNYYQGDSVSVNGDVSADVYWCTLSCTYELDGQTGSLTLSESNPSEEFSIIANLGGTGTFHKPLNVVCQTSGSFCTESDNAQSAYVTITYSYLGDGVCDTSEGEDCTKDGTESACRCSSPKSCINDDGDSKRTLDSKKCATYCGNDVVEKSYETCTNCPTDVGKCDGQYCSSGNECEGTFCVHSKCSHTKYVMGDSYCDGGTGETCINSPSDCVCGANQRCGSSGTCETFCGNGVCEAAEQGICNADCEWCGDGICDPDKESCRSCSTDCGECEKTIEEVQQTQQATTLKEEAVTKAEKTKNTRQVVNIAIGGGVGVILVAAASYFLLRKKKDPRKEQKSEKNVSGGCMNCGAKVSKSAKFCPKCGKKVR